jgi:biotin carboxylase
VTTATRPTLLLFVGTRGIRVADTCAALTALADVAVVTSQEVLDQRADQLDDTVAARDVLVAPTTAEIPARAHEYAGGTPVHGALTFSDDLVEVTAEFTAARGLPGQPPAAMPNFRDKYQQRRALAAAGVPVPPFALLRGEHDVAAALAAVPLPAMLKPTRGSGSALAFVITEPDELAPVLREAVARAPRVGAAIERDTEFILEGLLVGENRHPTPGFAPYVSVESVGLAGRVTHLGVTDRFPVAPPALETGMVLPSGLPAADHVAVLAAADQALRALDFHTGLAHTELMLTAAGPRVIEVNARAGGALPYLFPLVSNVDLTVEAGKVALGREPARDVSFTGYGVFVAPQHPVGVAVDRVDGLDRAAQVAGVRAVIPLAAGPVRTEDFQRTLIAAVLGTADTPRDATRLWREVMAAVRPVYAPAHAEVERPRHYQRTPM